MQGPNQIWTTASVRQRAVLVGGLVILAAGVVWTIRTAMQRHISFGEFSWVFFQCLILTGAVMSAAGRVARAVVRGRRRLRERR